MPSVLVSVRLKHFILCCLAAFVLPLGPRSYAQDGYSAINGKLMPFIVEGNDTVFLSPLPAAKVYEKKKRQKGRQWRKYYRLVYNFAKVYPYALIARDVVMEADSTITGENLKYIRKDRYVENLTKELFNAFEKPMRNLTVTQGALLMKLIDRECGITSYRIIRQFKNKYAAGFWQGVARLFGSDLKKPYDPDGEDAATEELVQQWFDGTFEKTYFEIFWEYPPLTEVPEKYRRPNLNTPNAKKQIPIQNVQKQK